MPSNMCNLQVIECLKLKKKTIHGNWKFFLPSVISKCVTPKNHEVVSNSDSDEVHFPYKW